MRFAYADPPYVGQAKRYGPDAREVNHRVLIGWLDADFDGWALSCSVSSLFELLPLVPWVQGRTRVLSWTKPYAPHRPGVWPTYAWEPVICRTLDRPSDRRRWTPLDWFTCEVGGKGRPGVGKQRILGEKPPAFVSWVLEACRVERERGSERVMHSAHREARRWRRLLAPHFSADTAFGDWSPGAPSRGHCAVVAVVVCVALPDTALVSATVHGVSHWFVRHFGYDIDVTADQFAGQPEIRVAPSGQLYDGTRERSLGDVNAETWRRVAILASRVALG